MCKYLMHNGSVFVIHMKDGNDIKAKIGNYGVGRKW